MELLLAFVIGCLYASGVYLLLRRSIVKLVLGLALISQGTNLLILTVGGLTRGKPAFIPDGQLVLTGDYADPLPQALILTAIVIGFGVVAFTLVMLQQVYKTVGTDDLDRMKSTDS
ncbi:MAG: Na+/H+ antiporter subunit C [Verrucomicrobia bacterium CG_4_10_14_3_um_filter_43_23]|nr:MAG: cation:proton antiporter [Verrucomicrobia bacterium CG1_02_43_26]PIP58510.1 MAG: Na+/H+ antiporter subunit C [Verrucomicrobia bacterium CG22_combo_CG10-13_8_21_14_all_43_17]PIX58182.1 MAG: Na+/H+ antiporter subunit C [Verrucomicrobia bacterium CG_4_10_14_3_um_filter_43_23]PIY60835.1 MAG: Na+/H+ antiporter subunit C [Verrucomicrobia bacterium CG_4_10_14_0_8_um_filter_43_34]PJA44325.1 MAG: Na+/H+ antiporter subunit C [Verrucomicrobia bacterium CG_4_9_14_3_um_filter_43_20]